MYYKLIWRGLIREPSVHECICWFLYKAFLIKKARILFSSLQLWFLNISNLGKWKSQPIRKHVTLYSHKGINLVNKHALYMNGVYVFLMWPLIIYTNTCQEAIAKSSALNSRVWNDDTPSSSWYWCFTNFNTRWGY